MSESGRENANLYQRGANEARGGALLEPALLLEILDVFGEDGIRAYLTGYAEGLEDLEEDE